MNEMKTCFFFNYITNFFDDVVAEMMMMNQLQLEYYCHQHHHHHSHLNVETLNPIVVVSHRQHLLVVDVTFVADDDDYELMIEM